MIAGSLVLLLARLAMTIAASSRTVLYAAHRIVNQSIIEGIERLDLSVHVLFFVLVL